MEMRSPPPAEAVVVMDRFVSASSAQDAIKSLEQIVDAFKISNTEGLDKKEDEISWQPAWIFEHEEIVEHLVWLLQHGTLKANESPCEEGVHLICQLYQQLTKSSDALMKPSPGALLESLLDILDHQEHPVYVRVLALRLLEDLSKEHKSIAVNQWLQAPNGLYRIGDLLAIDVENNPMEEAIRNQALIVAKSLAREAPMAKVFLFAEVDCKLLDLCWKEGGLTKGSPIVIDALELIQEVLKHADTSLQDLVWQRPNIAFRLVQLLDLRGGEEFLHPKQKSTQSVKNSDAEDDLDSILASGNGKSKEEEQVGDAPIPHLLPSEENVVMLVLNILRLLLETDSVREIVWRQQTGLCSIMWELALVSNPSDPPVCALPTPSLQQKALNLVADKINDPVIMDRLSGLDRLLYLVCTGGGISDTFKDKLGISQSALAVLRQNLSRDRIHDILMRTLAPPPTEDENAPPIGPTVVQKLWNTVEENLSAEVSEERTLSLSGALGGLGLLLCDEQSREIMFKVSPISVDQITECLSNEKESFVKCSLLRFLCEWVYECPFIAHNLLSSTASTNLTEMAAKPSDYQSLAHLLLGLSMEYLTEEEECGGWTRNGILQIIIKIGISKYTSSLEALKTTLNQKMPWIVSEMEHKNWRKFCRQAVLTIRKRVVKELAAGSGDSDDESDDNGNPSGLDGLNPTSSQGIRPLQRLVSQQATEIEEMTIRMEAAEAKVTSQGKQLSIWKRRMETNPTELDHMLNEFTSTNSDLEDKVRFLGLEIENQKFEKGKEIKSMQDKLSKCEVEADRLRSQEQEVRDDLERTEQEMKALSQAYTSLEEEYGRQQNEDGAGAQSAETSQQLEGEASHEQNGTGSTEVTTLRSENKRLKNDARKADEWMSMAVQKMNETGAVNVELEKQVSLLNSKFEESRAVADNLSHNNRNVEQQRRRLEAELENEKALRLAAEERLPYFENLQIKLEHELQRSEHLQHRVNETQEVLSNYEDMESKMQTEQQRVKELEDRVFEAEDATKVTAAHLKLETEAKTKLERQFNVTNNSNDQSLPSEIVDGNKILEQFRAEHDEVVASKNAEIDALRLSLLKEDEKELVGESSYTDTKDTISSSQMIDELRQSSQQKIYRLESVIRELKDRLGSDLGTYKVEDILARDEEIEELRKANESAQEWMGKAVEHHNRNSKEIQKLSDKNASLLSHLEEERKKQISGNTANSTSMENNEIQKWQEPDMTNREFAALKTELAALKEEQDANQGLLDELGIAMDDVAVMQQQLSEYKVIKSELERKLSGNMLSEENDDLRSSNEDLQKRLKEFEDWAQVAQNKIQGIVSAKDEIESRLKEVTEEVHSLRKENDALKYANAEAEDKKRVMEQLHEDVEKLKSANDYLQNEKNDRECEHQNLQSQHNILLESFNSIEQAFSALTIQRNGLQKDLVDQEQLSASQFAEIDNLKAANTALLDPLLQSKVRTGDDQVTATVIEENSATTNVASTDALESQAEENENVDKDDEVARIDDIVEELERTKVELAAAREELLSDEDVQREWEERTSHLESELANVHQQIQEQENEAENAIAKWQENVIELEEKCAELERNLKTALESKDAVDTMNNASGSDYSQLMEENASLQNKITYLETSLAGNSDNEIDSEIQHDDTVVELQKALKIAQETLAKDEEVVQRWEERTSELETKIESLESELRESEVEANEVIGQWQENCAATESKCTSIEEELNHLKAANQTQGISPMHKDIDEANYSKIMKTLAQKEEELQRLNKEAELSNRSLQKLKDDVLALNRQIESAREELVNREVEATKSIDQCNEILDASEQEKVQLKTDLDEARSEISELQDLRSKSSNDDEIALKSRETIRELSESVAMLEDQLKEQEQEALDAVDQWQSACSDLETKCANLELVINDSREMISEELRSCNESYGIQIEKLEATSKIVESSLRENLDSAKAEIERLVEVQEVERRERVDDQLQSQAKLEAEVEKNHEARDEIRKLSSSLEKINTDSEDTLNQWTVGYEKLKTALTDAQQQLEEQEIEANEAISIWETKTDELEKELDVAEDQLLQLTEILSDNSAGTQVNVIVAAEKLLHENTNLNAEIEYAKNVAEENASQARRLESENRALGNSLSTNEEKIQEMKLQQDQMAYQLSLKSEDKLEEERDRLIGVVAQLEEELREANSMLQACVTDGSTDKASEFAANAIRDDIYNLGNRLSEYQQRFDDEKAARQVAELEIERLRDDIVALLSLSDHEKSPTNIKKLTTKSIEKLQKLEHSEIDDLRKSLFRALEELEFTRSTERNTNETLSKLRLQISIYEQEIIAAKSEVNFLSEAMEEMRQTEDSKRASLEYRIGSLENENDVVRKYQANELESLRNELAQMTMEKDVILHQLKETERTNASLVLATSKEESSDSQQKSDINSECVKLRIENAHLLTIAAEDKGKAERRLRELLSAHVASSELDVILEHELRLSAEAALETLKEEMSELRNGKHSEKVQKTSDKSIEKELHDLRTCLENLKEQNARLKVTMDEEASKAKQMIDHLTDECRKAQAKAFKFDRETRTELAVQSEISKMRISTIALPTDKTSLYEDMIQSTRDVPSTSIYDMNVPSTEAFDLIRKQQKEIQEERMMYSETLQEHEDLLALVAQQDLEKSCLREALIEVAGDDVANDALKRAEEFAVIRYGNAVHVTN